VESYFEHPHAKQFKVWFPAELSNRVIIMEPPSWHSTEFAEGFYRAQVVVCTFWYVPQRPRLKFAGAVCGEAQPAGTKMGCHGHARGLDSPYSLYARYYFILTLTLSNVTIMSQLVVLTGPPVDLISAGARHA
jgi:hypothetical protein